MKRLAVLSVTIATLIAPTFSQAASGLDATQPAVEATTQPAVEATTKARKTRGSGVFNYDGTARGRPAVEATAQPAVEATAQPAVEATTKARRTRGSGVFNYDGTPRGRT
jgi:hypothetical protein